MSNATDADTEFVRSGVGSGLYVVVLGAGIAGIAGIAMFSRRNA